MNTAKVIRIKRARPSWGESLDDFITFKAAQGCAPRTLKDYRLWTFRFFRDNPGVWEDEHQARNAAMKYLSREIAPGTHNGFIARVGGFFSWAIEEGLWENHPLRGIKRKKDRGNPRDISVEAIQGILECFDLNTFSGLRNYALIVFTLDTAVRPGEALSLNPACFDLRGLSVTIPATIAKTRVARTIPMSEATVKLLRDLIGSRHPDWDEGTPVFCSWEGTRLRVSSWGHILAQASKKVGVKISPYMLRHAAATLFIRQGGNVLALQKVLGHADLTMTQRYVHLAAQDIRDEHTASSALRAVMPEAAHRHRKVSEALR